MHMSVHSRIWGMVGLFVFSLLLTGILYVASERQTLLAEKKLKTRQLVELAVSRRSTDALYFCHAGRHRGQWRATDG